MADETPPTPPSDPNAGQPAPQQQQQQAPISARVPAGVARGVFTTGQVVLDGPKEFVVDFFQHLTRPHQVVARVVLTPATMSELITALHTNLDNYTRSFGAPPPLPLPGPSRTSLQELYDNFKVPDEMLSGVYSNGVLIGHSPSEFFFDFLTAFYPAAAVSARVFLPASQAPRFLAALENAYKQHRQKMTPPPPPPAEPLG
jgi:hypothetical protein